MKKLANLFFACASLTGVIGAAATAAAQTNMMIATGVDPAFSQFYVAKEAGLFAKHNLNVTINTGASGSAMIPFLIENRVQAAYGSDLGGVINHNIDPNIVAVADGSLLVRWLAVVGRNVPDLNALKGKRIAYVKGNASELLWNGVIKKFHLDPKDYKMVEIEGPEMVAALERGDVDAMSAWEPWVSRAVLGVPNTKILVDSEGIYSSRNFIYMNRTWIKDHHDAALDFIRALIEANDIINNDRPQAAKMVAKFLNMPEPLVVELMPKVVFGIDWSDGAITTIENSIALLKSQGKMPKPLDWKNYIDSELVRAVRPANVKITKLPTN